MPKRNRHKELLRSGQIIVEPKQSQQQRDVQIFAESVKAEKAAERKAREEALEALRRANLHDELTAAKAAAVTELKAARARGGERVAAAEANYRKALAELQEFETGERPTWAPALPPAEAADDEADVTDEPSSEGDAE